jgi:signal transduction histidine kinase
MRKTSIIVLILIIEIVLLFVFQNISMWFNELGDMDFQRIRNPLLVKANVQKMAKMFSSLSIAIGVLILGTGFYLGMQFKKPKLKEAVYNMPPLQDYLVQLKGSETKLKDLVEQQQVDVTEKEELTKSIINNINAAVIFVNSSSQIDIFNPVAQELFSRSYVLAKNGLLTKTLEEFPAIVDFVERHEDKEISGEVSENERIFAIDLNPIENIGQLIFIREVTEEKRREEFDRRNGNFIMLGEMAAFLAHEVRNSLSVMYGYTGTIKGEKEKTKAEKVNKEINHLSAMMDSFLNFSKPLKKSKAEAVDLVELVNGAAEETGVTVEREDGLSEVKLEGDPAMIRAIFSNLFINANEAGADRVVVQFEKLRDNTLELTLADNGSGIEEDIKDKIWYPFFTTKSKGTGMGLAMIRKIMTSLNGEIQLMDTGSEGTTFLLTFYG